MLPPPTPATELACTEDDHTEFERHYAAYFIPLRSFILGLYPRTLTDRAERAEDLTQDTFCKAWKAWANFTPGNDLSRRNWLFHIAKNVFLDAIRHERLIEMVAWNDYASPLPAPRFPLRRNHVRYLMAGPPDHPEDVVVSQELEREVRLVLDTLPTNWAKALELREYGECSYDEIAEALHTTRSAIKSMLFRARGRVAENGRFAAYAQDTEAPRIDTAILRALDGAPPLKAFYIRRRVERWTGQPVDVTAFTKTLDRLIAAGSVEYTPTGFVAVQG